MNLNRVALGLVVALGLSSAAFAEAPIVDMTPYLKVSSVNAGLANALDMKVGDVSHYAIDIGGFLKGTMDMSVREEIAEGIWVVQNLDIQVQKQVVETLLNKNTGEVIKMIVNGQPQEVKKQDVKIISTAEATITVPAGTFKTIDVKAHDNTQNQDIEEWINPKDVPVGGAVQIQTTAQGMKVNIQLTSFKKN